MDIRRDGLGNIRFAFSDLPNARLIRKTVHDGDGSPTLYIVAVSKAAHAVTIIRNKAANPNDIVQDLGRISGPAVQVLNLAQGEFVRVDSRYRPLPTKQDK